MEQKRCVGCQVRRRVTDISSIRKGQQLCIAGRKLNKTITFLGIHDIIYFYTHHFIVEEIDPRPTSSSCDLLVTHFYDDTATDAKKAKVKKEMFHIDLKEAPVFIVEYDEDTGDDGDMETRRRQEINDDPKYNLILNNCENLATKIKTGHSVSLQVREFATELMNIILSSLEILGDIIWEFIPHGHLLNFLEASFDNIHHWHEISLVSISVKFIAFLIMVGICAHDKIRGVLCRHCFINAIISILGSNGISCLVSVASFLCFSLLSLCLPIKISVLIAIFLFDIAFGSYFKKMSNSSRQKFPWKKIKLDNTSKIKRGVVLSLSYMGLDHKVLCLEFTATADTTGELECIHYACPRLFGPRKIIEDRFRIDLNASPVYKCNVNDTFKADEAIERARHRLNEEKFHFCSNRSSHFCFWAISKPDLRYSLTGTGFAKYAIAEIHISEEVPLAAVVEYGSAIGIVIEKTNHENAVRNLRLTVICKGRLPFWSLKQEEWNIDLSKDRLYRHIYLPALIRSEEKTIERAKYLRKEGKRYITRDSFIIDCILDK